MLNRLRILLTKPRSLPQSNFSFGKVILDELADIKRRTAALESRPVTTTYEGDHEDIKILIRDNIDLENRVSSLEHTSHEPYDFTDFVKRIEHLENNHIQALTRRISSANWQRPRRKDGRWTKRGGGHASA